jgi:hypothetical protein
MYLRYRCNNKFGGSEPVMNYVESGCQAVESKEGRGEIVYAYTNSTLPRAP